MVGAEAYDRMVPLVAPAYHQGKLCIANDQPMTAYRLNVSFEVVFGYHADYLH